MTKKNVLDVEADSVKGKEHGKLTFRQPEGKARAEMQKMEELWVTIVKGKPHPSLGKQYRGERELREEACSLGSCVLQWIYSVVVRA